MQNIEKLEEITEKLKSYIQTNYELIKLQTIERSSVILAELISNILVGLVVILFVFFLSVCAGFYLSSRLGEYYLGFAIVAGFYFLCSLILIVLRKKLLERPMRDKIITEIFKT
ncbi:MAG: hypothetical protein A2066_06610 [Bacteroidetes bacterium GWB2_41_8]|nr:MAG: hypothetical protein A2066_06610 [Bacteroidetes bacterium GWB2_41_8]